MVDAALAIKASLDLVTRACILVLGLLGASENHGVFVLFPYPPPKTTLRIASFATLTAFWGGSQEPRDSYIN